MKIFEQLERQRHWNEDERMLLDQVQRLADQVIAPAAELYDRSGEFPQKNVDAINALGLNALFVPEAYGGAPMSIRLYLRVVQIISEACASTGIIYATNYHGMKPLIDVGTEEQKQRLLPLIAEGGLGALAITEPEAGSDATGMKPASRPTVTTSSSTAPRFSSPTAISPTGFCCSANGRRSMIPKKPSRL